jgi:thiamine-monophosphate kinase
VVQKNSSEFSRIAGIARLLDQGRGRGVIVGIGDDAAVLRAQPGRLVWTTDSSVQDVHFRCDILSMQDIGWRSYHAAVSDIAAMGAKALAALSALELPVALPDRSVYAIVEGQASAAKWLKCPLVGGNLSRADKIAINTSVLGCVDAPILRSKAQVGDELWLIGPVGMAAAGLGCLLREGPRLRGHAVECCVEAFRRPMALLRQGKGLVGRANSAIDISDGLAGDAAHIAESSRVAVELDERQLSASLPDELLTVAKKLRRTALSFALYGGEDYSLLATGPKVKRPRGAVCIGRIIKGKGVWLVRSDGAREALGRGFEHFGN